MVKKIITSIKNGIFDICMLFWARACLSCGEPLGEGEISICTKCRMDIPLTSHYDNIYSNDLMYLFLGRVDIKGACSFFYYKKNTHYSRLVHNIKFFNQRRLAYDMGLWYGRILKERAVFADADYIVPVPLHKSRESERGYNQSYYIAYGMSDSMSIPIGSSFIVRKKNSKQQARLVASHDRWENMLDAFTISDKNSLSGSTVVIVDDVVTTGSTIISMIKTINEEVPDCKVYVAALSSVRKKALR